jgi:hypothetical protein
MLASVIGAASMNSLIRGFMGVIVLVPLISIAAAAEVEDVAI